MNSSVLTYAAVGVGAGLGGICRYAITMFFVARYGPGLPLGTFVINLSGSFLIGLISELAQTRAVGIDPLLRVGLTAGFLGGYTTFSTFAFETRTLAAERQWMLSLGYAFLSLIAGVALCYAGIFTARLMERAA